MGGTSLLALPGDIARLPGDVALMTKAVTRKSAVLPGEMFPTDIRNA